MADYAASGSVVALEDPGTGATDHHDPDSAGMLAAPSSPNQTQVVEGLGVDVDTTNDEITVNAGMAVIRYDNPDVQTEPGGDYNRTLQGPVPLGVSVDTTTVAVDADAVNDVYLYVDTANDDGVQIRVGSSVAEPTEPSLYLAELHSGTGEVRYADLHPEWVRGRALQLGHSWVTPRSVDELTFLANGGYEHVLLDTYSSHYDTKDVKVAAQVLHIDYHGPNLPGSVTVGDSAPARDGCVIDLNNAPITSSDIDVLQPATDQVTVRNVNVQDGYLAVGLSSPDTPEETFIQNITGAGPDSAGTDLEIATDHAYVNGTLNCDINVYGSNVVISGTDVNTTVTIYDGNTNVYVDGMATVTDNDGSNYDQTV